MVPPNSIDVSDLHTLGWRDFDLRFNWDETIVSNGVEEVAIDFIRTIQSTGVDVADSHIVVASPSSFSEKQQIAFEIILHHPCQSEVHEPLQMIIQGTTDTGKSYLT